MYPPGKGPFMSTPPNMPIPQGQPMPPNMPDPVVVQALTELRTTVVQLTNTMQSMEKRLHLVYTVVVLVVGVVGGPNAIQAIVGH